MYQITIFLKVCTRGIEAHDAILKQKTLDMEKCMKCRAYNWKHAPNACCTCWISPHDKPTHLYSVGPARLALLYMTVVCGPKEKLGSGKCGGVHLCSTLSKGGQTQRRDWRTQMRTASERNNKMVNTMLWLLKSGWSWETVTLLSEEGEAARAPATKTLAMQLGEREIMWGALERSEMERTGEEGVTLVGTVASNGLKEEHKEKRQRLNVWKWWKREPQHVFNNLLCFCSSQWLFIEILLNVKF